MIKIIRWLALVLGVGLWSCATGPSADRAPRYHFEIADRPHEKRFVLTLKSLDDRPLCLGIGQWPNKRGQMDFGSSWITLSSAERTYRPRDHNFGYCPGCEIHIAPGSTLTGFIKYAEFGSPAAISALSNRRLHFPVTLWICKATRP